MARPMEEMKKEIGITTAIAPNPVDPTHLPTNIASTIELMDIIRKPIAAGTDCLMSSLLIGSSPRALECSICGKFTY
jgi:hypothetical protein